MLAALAASLTILWFEIINRRRDVVMDGLVVKDLETTKLT